jgi:MFS family permease
VRRASRADGVPPVVGTKDATGTWLARLARLLGGAEGAALLRPGDGRLVLTTFVGYAGFGLYVAGSAVYFTQSAGLSTVLFGTAMSVGGIASLALSVPVGRLCDRWSARSVVVALSVLQAVALASTPLLGQPALVVAIVCLLAILENSGNVAWSGLLAHAAGPQRRLRLAAFLRSVQNLGVTAGLAGSAVALSLDSRPAYVGMILLCAVASLGKAALTLLVRQEAAITDAVHPSLRAVLGDLPYLGVAVVNGLLTVADVVLTIGLPLWIVEHTTLPRATIAAVVALNTALVVLCQVRVSRHVLTLEDGRRAQVAGCVALAGGCGLLAISGSVAPILAAAVLASSVVLITVGKLLASAAAWSLRYGLAAEHAQGSYSGLFGLGSGIKLVAGPVLVTAPIAAFAGVGWIALGALFLVLAPLSSACVAKAALPARLADLGAARLSTD